MKTKLLATLFAVVGICTAAYTYISWSKWFIWPELRAPLMQSLKDPKSAEFREERQINNHLCGEINAKNSHGGYVGFKRFIAQADGYAIEESTLRTLTTAEPTTEEIISGLDVKLKLMKNLKREPTAQEVDSAVFEEAWKKYCPHQ